MLPQSVSANIAGINVRSNRRTGVHLTELIGAMLGGGSYRLKAYDAACARIGGRQVCSGAAQRQGASASRPVFDVAATCASYRASDATNESHWLGHRDHRP